MRKREKRETTISEVELHFEPEKMETTGRKTAATNI